MQQGLNVRIIQFTESDYDIDLTVFQCLGRGWSDAVDRTLAQLGVPLSAAGS